MNVDFTPLQEAKLLQIANDSGKPAEQVVKDAALRLLENSLAFVQAFKRASTQPIAVISSKKKRWTRPSNNCLSPNA